MPLNKSIELTLVVIKHFKAHYLYFFPTNEAFMVTIQQKTSR
jgi:hypothetical protein